MNIYTEIESPVGPLLLVGAKDADGGRRLASLSMAGQRSAPKIRDGWTADAEAFSDVSRQLREYFAGTRSEFDLEYLEHLEDTATGSDFQRSVWAAIDTIPHGTTTTYGALAKQLGLPRDRVQALGAAVGANPLLIVRPCHRVIGADGSMRGYAGGVENKQWLLALEGAIAPLLV
ncbi:methylated-DNA--[protein]-cysteine S-methyltransferase [Catenulispora sp. NF23]|uniref:Methylated-DNA--[protein]-cysteine S-methyltransferase n=1 Tax=Catenulispora pinistramenti TaxID=2705254 RepID=A0ABS5KVI1_9ACTN|nr:methylated-DNA--[protein]-cysteine S-methyltransferase [Catenulispora pinistramenti]MBS2534984.1 methylated-DNA--[protein]-cysteine S-methyltransferase [Catenulispora pinistramenti]MBS2550015.1 methylated-DNA--[protein]-cysteine S-methyltransferase [Catenulispora pinistramenti]